MSWIRPRRSSTFRTGHRPRRPKKGRRYNSEKIARKNCHSFTCGLGFDQYRFQSFQAVEAWGNLAFTAVLFLEYQRAKHLADRRLNEDRQRWWRSQRLHGLCIAFRQESEASELKYISERPKTPGGIATLQRALANASPKEYRVAQ